MVQGELQREVSWKGPDGLWNKHYDENKREAGLSFVCGRSGGGTDSVKPQIMARRLAIDLENQDMTELHRK